MKILLTNDDGINSPGIKAMEKALSSAHEVLVVAPEGERSGFSNSLTFHGNVKITKIDAQHYSCSGTPADCVHRTLHRIINGFYPDIVVSGINHGPNLGTDIIYSGTAAAARQAAIMGVPGIAVSVTSFTEPFYFENAYLFVAENVSSFAEKCDSSHFVNINVPSVSPFLPGVMVTRPSRRVYREKILHNFHLDNETTDISIDVTGISCEDEYGTDCYAVGRGMISVSPLVVQPVNDVKAGEIYKTVFCRGKNG